MRLSGHHKESPELAPPDDRLVEQFLQDQVEDVRRAAVSYAGRFGSAALISTLEGIGVAAPTLREAVGVAVEKIGARTDPVALLRSALAPGSRPGSRGIELVRDHARSLSDAELAGALSHDNASIRCIAIDALHDRGSLSVEQATPLLDDSSLDVVVAAVRALIGCGAPPSAARVRKLLKERQQGSIMALSPPVPADELLLKLMETQRTDDLLGLIDWYTVDGPLAYEIVGKRESEGIERVRADLRDDFEQLRKRSVERMRGSIMKGAAANLGRAMNRPEVRATLEETAQGAIDEQFREWRKLDEFVRSRFVVAALRILAKCGDGKDVEIVRAVSVSDYDDVRVVVAELLGRWGDESDVDRLVSIGKSSYGDVAEKAAKAALRCTRDFGRLVVDFVTKQSPAMGKAAICVLEEDQSLVLPDGIVDGLWSDDAGIRVNVARMLGARLAATELEGILNRYTRQQKYNYYYDVVAEFDRVLYGSNAVA